MIVRFLTVLFLLSSSVYAQSQKIDVAVQISMEGSEETLVTSYINRELRALNDIEITNEASARYIISIVMIKDTNSRGDELGYSASIVVTMLLNKNEVERLASTYPVETKPTVRDYYSSFGRIEKHFLKVGDKNNLPLMCRSIVAKVDVDVFESDRGVHRAIQNRKKQ